VTTSKKSVNEYTHPYQKPRDSPTKETYIMVSVAQPGLINGRQSIRDREHDVPPLRRRLAVAKKAASVLIGPHLFHGMDARAHVCGV